MQASLVPRMSYDSFCGPLTTALVLIAVTRERSSSSHAFGPSTLAVTYIPTPPPVKSEFTIPISKTPNTHPHPESSLEYGESGRLPRALHLGSPTLRTGTGREVGGCSPPPGCMSRPSRRQAAAARVPALCWDREGGRQLSPGSRLHPRLHTSLGTFLLDIIPTVK